MAQANNLVVFCIALSLGGVGGMLLPSMSGDAASAEHEAIVPLDPRPELSQELGALALQVEELKKMLGARVMERPTTEGRTPVERPEQHLVLSELRELISSLTELKYQSVRPPMQLSEVAAIQPRRGVDALFAPFPDFTSDDFDWKKHNTELTSNHFLWSAHDLVRTYGPPESIDEDDPFMFVYGIPDSRLKIFFMIREGIVYDVRLYS